MTMSFEKMMKDYTTLVHGHGGINLPPHVSLASAGKLLSEQRENLVYILAEMIDENLSDFDQGLKEAAIGLQFANKKLSTLRAVTQRLKENGQAETPKLAMLVEKIEDAYEEVGVALKELLVGTKAALRVQTGDERD